MDKIYSEYVGDHFLALQQMCSVIALEKTDTAVDQRKLLPSKFPQVKKRKPPENIAGSGRESSDARKKPRLTPEAKRKQQAFLEDNLNSEEDENVIVHVGEDFYLRKKIHDNLYPYQRESLLWFWRLHRKGKGGILGDDMGLGKTVQVVAFITGLLDMKQASSVLIVLPVAVIINWEGEFKKWTSGINIQRYHGSSKGDKGKALMEVQKRGGVLLTSYGLVRTRFQEMIQCHGSQFDWDYIILDEGHKIKNPGITTKAIHSIPARHRLIITGTPIQNNLKELWSLCDFVTHGSVLGTIKTFMMEYGNPITRAREKDASASEKRLGNEMAESLRKLIDPYFLRRTKADVLEGKGNANAPESSDNEGSNLDDNKIVQGIPRLTRKKDFIIWLHLAKKQIQIYKDFTQLVHIKELLMTKRSPLAELNVIKKLCDHPRLLSARACQLLSQTTTESIEEEPKGEEGSSAVSGSQSTGCDIEDIDDDTLIAESGKIQFLLELLHNLTAEGHRTLVFSQSRKMLDIVEKILRNQNFKYMRMDGTVSKLSDREQRIKCFQSNKSYSVFLLTTQVGGVGLTLTGADRVVIIDPSWNPATDNQAVDRTYRIGQTKPVVIYRLITCGTVEEKIYRRQVFKESITKQATGASKNPYRYFSRQELRELFKLDDPYSSSTQEQLQEMHSAHRKTDRDLDTHIAFLHSLDSVYGISDHDLMFSQEAIKDESTGSEIETENYIQRRIQRAQDLLLAESDSTVQLREQLHLNIQAPDFDLHHTELKTDSTKLGKEMEKAHKKLNDVNVATPGAGCEEHYLLKKNDSMLYGMYHHNLMFPQKAIKEENIEFEHETAGYTQKRIHKAEGLLSAGSHSATVRLRELQSHAQTPGVHHHATQLKTDSTKLGKESKKAHKEPNDVRVPRPGTSCEEHNLSKKNDSMPYSMFDHNLMFPQKAIKEENIGFEHETEGYTQKRVQRTPNLLSAESDSTVQVRKHLHLNTQATGVHPHSKELKKGRTGLQRKWENGRGEPTDILQPGASCKERHLSKKNDTADAGSTLKDDGDTNNHIKASPARKQKVTRKTHTNVTGIGDNQESKKGEEGEIKKIKEENGNKMGEREVSSSSPVPSSITQAEIDANVCSNNLRTQQLKDSLNVSSMSPPRKPAVPGKGNTDDDFASFLEWRDSLISSQKRSAGETEDSDDEEEGTENFGKPCCLVSDSDQSEEEEWYTAKRHPALSPSFAIGNSDWKVSAIEASFQKMVVKQDSVEEKISIVNDCYQQNESIFDGRLNGAAFESGEEQDIDGVEEYERFITCEDDGERYPCSENLDDADKDMYYRCIEKAESYREKGMKSRALLNFLKAHNIDSHSQYLQLQIVALAREVKC